MLMVDLQSKRQPDLLWFNLRLTNGRRNLCHEMRGAGTFTFLYLHFFGWFSSFSTYFSFGLYLYFFFVGGFALAFRRQL